MELARPNIYLKIHTVDSFIIFFMFALLPVDMINGIMLTNGINLPITVGQLHKFLILLFIFFTFLFKPVALLISLTFLGLFLIPSILQIGQAEPGFLLDDIIKISKYLLPLFCFLYFTSVMKRAEPTIIAKTFKLIAFSYIVLISNIFIKYLGFGYPMYEFGDIGSKGFFYAGNEISVLLLILSSIIAFRLWKNKERKKYYLFLLLNVIAGLGISSKTAVLGIIIIFLLIPLKRPSLKTNIKKIGYFLLSFFVILPILLYVSWEYVKNSAVYGRIIYFWEKLDFWTFLLSNRNNFFWDAWIVYKEGYNFLEKIIGVGQTKYEALNYDKIVEMDFADIFFAYGFIGLILFISIILFLMAQSLNFSNNEKYVYANFVFMMAIILAVISTMAGHVFSSSMAAVFIGLLFSLMYLKNNNDKTTA